MKLSFIKKWFYELDQSFGRGMFKTITVAKSKL